MKQSRSDTKRESFLRSLTSVSLTAMRAAPRILNSQRTGSRPKVSHERAIAMALEARNTIPNCRLSDEAVTFLALRCNSVAPTKQIAKIAGISAYKAYMLAANPQAQELIAHLARGLLGQAAITGLSTMTRLMHSKDAHVAHRAAEAVMERAGYGRSTNASAPSGTTAFAFSFSGSQTGATDGTRKAAPMQQGASKIGGSDSGEGAFPAISDRPEVGREPLPEDVEVQPGSVTLRPLRPSRRRV